MSPAFRSVPGIYPCVCLRSSYYAFGAALSTRLDFSIVDIFAYSCVPFEHFNSPRFGPQVPRGGGILYQLCYRAGSIAAGNDSALLGCASPPVDVVGRLALLASASSRINRRHVQTSIHARTLQPARRVTAAVVAYPAGSPRLRGHK